MDNGPESKQNPVLSFAAIKDLTGGGRKDLAATFVRLGELLASSGLRGTLQVRLVNDDEAEQTSCFRVTLRGGKAKTSTTPTTKPSVELVTQPETWLEIASGKLSPISAFLQGRMRIRGDTDLAEEMLKHVAGSPSPGRRVYGWHARTSLHKGGK